MTQPLRTLLGDIGARLEITLSEPTQLISPRLLNRQATPTARIESVKLESYAFEDDRPRPFRDDELDAIAFDRPEIVLRGLGTATTHHLAPNGTHFTVRDLLQAIEDSERATRSESTWFDGVDVHHIYFEGIDESDSGVWEIGWGS